MKLTVVVFFVMISVIILLIGLYVLKSSVTETFVNDESPKVFTINGEEFDLNDPNVKERLIKKREDLKIEINKHSDIIMKMDMLRAHVDNINMLVDTITEEEMYI